MQDHTNVAYWNSRVRENLNDRRRMLFIDPRFDEYERRVKRFLSAIYEPGLKVLDVACGFGRLCGCFKPEDYQGIDFSEEMTRLAEAEHPGYKFRCFDFKAGFFGKYDIIFEVNSLKALGTISAVMQPEDFIERAFPLLDRRGMVAALECGSWYVKQYY